MPDALPIEGDEVLLRRFDAGFQAGQPGWYDPDSGLPPSLFAFGCLKQDTDGLSLVRARIRGLHDEVANGRPRKTRFWVAAFRVRDLPAGLSVVPSVDPVPDWYPDGDPAHVIIPELKYPDRKSADLDVRRSVENWMKAIAELPRLTVTGPYSLPLYPPPARWQPQPHHWA